MNKKLFTLNALIIDDEKDQITLVKNFLKNLPVKIKATTSPIEGIEMIKTHNKEGHPFHIVFIDLKMPEMNGIKTAKVIRQIDEKVILMAVTNYDTEENKAELIHTGYFDYIMGKGSTLQAFQNTVSSIRVAYQEGNGSIERKDIWK